MPKRRRGRRGTGLVTAMGLMRFYEETESKIKIPPEAVIIASLAISVIAVAVRALVH